MSVWLYLVGCLVGVWGLWDSWAAAAGWRRPSRRFSYLVAAVASLTLLVTLPATLGVDRAAASTLLGAFLLLVLVFMVLPQIWLSRRGN